MMKRCAMIVAFFASCGPTPGPPDGTEQEPTWLDTRQSTDAAPALLSEVGLYRDPGSLGETHPSAILYEPLWPLWSNGLRKSRYVVLPADAKVRAGDAWEFPEGTLFFKTFEDDDGPVETRLMQLGAEGWTWSTYVWDEDRLDAELSDGRRSVEVEVTVDGEAFTHEIPNELDCRTCHEPDPARVLGFSPLQLGASVADFDLFDETPSSREVEHPDEDTREVLGWFVGNCTSCHNGNFDHDQSSFDLRPDVALENIIDQMTDSSASIEGVRVVPGDPDSSVLYLAVSGESDDPELKLMPPLGVQRRDEAAITRLRAWIEDLAP